MNVHVALPIGLQIHRFCYVPNDVRSRASVTSMFVLFSHTFFETDSIFSKLFTICSIKDFKLQEFDCLIFVLIQLSTVIIDKATSTRATTSVSIVNSFSKVFLCCVSGTERITLTIAVSIAESCEIVSPFVLSPR